MHSAWHLILASGISIVALAWLLVRVRPGRADAGRAGDWTVAVAMLAVLAAWRWPFLLSPAEFNPDESQLAAGAITLLHDPVFWRSVDGTTSGPVNFYVLMPLLGLEALPPVFATRLTGLLIAWAALACTHAFLRRATNPVVALLGMLPAGMLLATTTDWDFIHYSSEHASLALLGAAALCLQSAAASTTPVAGWRWTLAALLAGLLPWAKPQSAPFAALLAAVAVVQACRTTGLSWRSRFVAVVLFAGVSLAPAAFFVGLAAATGQLGHLYASYVVNNLAYAAAQSGVASTLAGMWELSNETWFFPLFLKAVLSCAVIGLLGASRPWRFRPALLWMPAAVVVAVFTVLAPSLPFHHYLLYLVLPGAALAAVSLHPAWENRPALRPVLGAFVVLAGCVFPISLRCSLDLVRGKEPVRLPVENRLAEVVHHFGEPGDTVAIWGWAPRILVVSRLPHGTRDGNAARQIQLSAQRDTYYIPRFIEDMRRNRPALFIDAVGAGLFQFHNRPHQAHDTIGELAALVRENYRLMADLHGARLYVRGDLLTARNAAVSRLETAIRAEIAAGAGGHWPMTLTGLPHRRVHQRDALHLQTPAEFTIPLAGDETDFFFSFGMEPRSYIAGTTNGAELRVELLVGAGPAVVLFSRSMDPKRNDSDRGLLQAHVPLPTLPAGAHLVIRALPGQFDDAAWDWVFLAEARFARRIGP